MAYFKDIKSIQFFTYLKHTDREFFFPVVEFSSVPSHFLGKAFASWEKITKM